MLAVSWINVDSDLSLAYSVKDVSKIYAAAIAETVVAHCRLRSLIEVRLIKSSIHPIKQNRWKQFC